MTIFQDGLTGNLLDDSAEALVNTVNCMGVMGAGIALQFRERYPNMYTEYKANCYAKLVRVGWVGVYEVEERKFVINFPTKNHWREPSQYKWIEDGLIHLATVIEMHKITSIAIPKIGCGLGSLSWDRVYPLIKTHLADLEDVEVRIYGEAPKENQIVPK